MFLISLYRNKVNQFFMLTLLTREGWIIKLGEFKT